MILSSSNIFAIQSKVAFETVCLDIFRYQAERCEFYRAYLKNLGVNPLEIKAIENIPFLPIRFFKERKVYSAAKPEEVTFTSSSTTGTGESKHFVSDISIYEESFRRGFQQFYGEPNRHTILALLPSYLERNGSSLIYMVEDLIKQSGKSDSGFFLYNHGELFDRLNRLKKAGESCVLIGVSFALLDFAEHYPINFPELIVMETGGMKGHRKEMVREELHGVLCKGFGVENIHSEYGMTECLSQAYSKGRGLYRCPPWMKVMVRDIYAPFNYVQYGVTGGVNIIDLANIYSCSFIETQDLGKANEDGFFEILGRFDNSDIRGCNLMV
ncbi:MAG: acyltransferase [Prevotellaceae bacterium]|jgi:phenylacetate-coenzyme A ligase PaaK-like adenylate-forming protein|nr:acyltransferase [Prevotellaceae bacterium]